MKCGMNHRGPMYCVLTAGLVKSFAKGGRRKSAKWAKESRIIGRQNRKNVLQPVETEV